MELTKQDVKEIFTGTLEPFAKAVQEDFQKVNQRLDKVKSDVKWMRENFSELFVKLDEFISLYKRQAEELSALSHQFQRLEERVAALEVKIKT